MFLGEFVHNIDQKNRLRIPPKFRKDFVDGAIVTKGNDGCLFLVAKDQFSSIFNSLNSLPLFDSNLQMPVRMLFSSACEVEEDNQGRFLLPQTLKSFAGIAKEVVFVGVGNRVELWSKERWQDYSNKANANFDQILSSLGEHGI